MQGLTKRQRELTNYIRDFIDEHHYSPGYREIMQHFNFTSPGTVYKHLKVLQKKGVIEKEAHGRCSIAESAAPLQKSKQIIPTDTPTFEIPLIGRLHSGLPIETFIEYKMITVDKSIITTQHLSDEERYGLYALEVADDKRLDEAMLCSDIIIVSTQLDHQDGDTILMEMIDNAVIVKKIYSVDNYLRLESCNPNLQPLFTREGDGNIIGVVVALTRSYSR